MYYNMKNVGIAYIIQKKQFTKNEKTKDYYEIIDYACGFVVKNNGYKFTSLSTNVGYILPLDYDSNREFLAINFKCFDDFLKQNNYRLDIKKFMDSYKKHIGELYFYNSINDKYVLIDDIETIDFIEKQQKKTTKEFDESVLDKSSHISQMYSEIKKTIISQDEQIMQILTTLFKNQKVINSDFDIDMIGKLKENLLIYGPTGTGKTEILKRISKIYKVPIVIEDATSLTESGFVGRDINDMLKDLYLSSGKKIDLAQKGILVIDEFDKLAEKNSGRSHVSREGVQRSLLKLLDGTEYYFDGITFNTTKLSIVALGAFTNITNNDDYSNITIKNFTDYGIMRELMGRFSKLVPMNPLNKDDIKKILVESNFSPINTYQQLFESMNINFTYDDEFIEYIALKAIELNSGARSLKTVFDNIISSAMFRIFAGDYSSIHLTSPKLNENSYILTKKKKI